MASTITAHEIPYVSTGLPAPKPHPVDKRQQFLFIHTVRFWSMVGIVLIHGALSVADIQVIPVWEKTLMDQAFKFGTIGFFLISGFLIGDRLPASKPFSYMRRRFNRLVPAWALWWGLDTLNIAKRDLLHIHRAGLGTAAALESLWSAAIWVLTMTPVWFVPNLLIALTCVVFLRRWIDDLRLGALFLAFNLFYDVNVYTDWIPNRHTEALFGYVFYLWLGAWCARRKDRVLPWLESLSGSWLRAAACITASAAIGESFLLSHLKNPDMYNSLRISNQVFSLIVVILLVRVKRRTWPAFINVAETTYGIYHSHPMVLGALVYVVARILTVHGHVFGPGGLLLMWLLLSSITYFGCLKLVQTFASRPGWAWVVGAANLEPRNWAVTAKIRSIFLASPTEA